MQMMRMLVVWTMFVLKVMEYVSSIVDVVAD